VVVGNVYRGRGWRRRGEVVEIGYEGEGRGEDGHGVLLHRGWACAGVGQGEIRSVATT
jgi:hypothetical protein